MIRFPFARTWGYALLVVWGASAHAGQAWLEAGDAQLRDDLAHLADAGVIRLPLTGWPIPVADIERVLADVDIDKEASPAIDRMLERVRHAIRPSSDDRWGVSGVHAIAGNPGLLREFDTPIREEGEFGADLAALGNRWAAEARVSAVTSPADGQEIRLDGSHLTVRFGNWLMSANMLDRWWGPGYEGSLLLSSNARPVPALSLDRATSAPFNVRGLRWLGPWRLNAFMGQMENHRQDRDRPLLFGMRFAFEPLRGLEIALERTAQWCGEGLPCGVKAFRNLFLGHDNQGENVRPEDEPGNQLAGWSVRWASPVGHLPYALYIQHTGETIDNKFPRPLRSLDLMGVELWGERASGASWRAHVEYADTSCGSADDPGQFDCAYNNSLFNREGYRYRGRTLGYSADGDSRMYSLGLLATTPRAITASILVRYGELNRGGAVPDLLNKVADRPTDWRSLQIAAQVPHRSDRIRFGIGVERAVVTATDRGHDEIGGFLEWRRDF